jgi:hypothetical protein
MALFGLHSWHTRNPKPDPNPNGRKPPKIAGRSFHAELKEGMINQSQEK